MKALVYADLQATEGHERCFGNPTKALQLYRVDRFFNELDRIYREHQCEALWDLGDTTDDRTAVPVPVIDLMCDRLERYRGQWNLKLVGNHEQFLRDTRVHAGKMFRAFFHVVNGCEAFKIKNVNVLCVSYHDDERPVMDFLRLFRPQKPALLLGHLQLFGSQLPGGIAASGMAHEALDFVDMGLLGHIHRPQSHGKLHYVGSPFQQNWGESGEGKRVGIVDIDGNRIEVTWVPLEGFPVYRQVSLSDFLASVKPGSEDRYKVVLRNADETERYYAHPLANRADEAIYAYDAAVPGNAVSSSGEEVLPRSKPDIMARYLVHNPAKDVGIGLDAADMLAFGEQISSGA